MKIYKYKDIEYKTESSLRKAIWYKERKALPKCSTVEEWAEHGVELIITEMPEPTLDELKIKKLNQLDRAFMQWRNDGATLVSSLGFNADCDERAMIDVNGLVTICNETQKVAFMDAGNQLHELSLEQLKVLQVEIIQSGNMAYQTKWQLRAAIEAAESKEVLDAVEIVFTAADFTVEA